MRFVFKYLVSFLLLIALFLLWLLIAKNNCNKNETLMRRQIEESTREISSFKEKLKLLESEKKEIEMSFESLKNSLNVCTENLSDIREKSGTIVVLPRPSKTQTL
jgi:septal ring factor EnvC (AmiA/AmiB activator)